MADAFTAVFLHHIGSCPVGELTQLIHQLSAELQRRAGLIHAQEPLKPSHGFDLFWEEWPAHKRKVAKVQCLKKWESKGCAAIADDVMRSLRAHKASFDWLKSGGEYIPAPLVWLNQARWEATLINASAPYESPRVMAARLRVAEMSGGLAAAKGTAVFETFDMEMRDATIPTYR